MQFKRISNFYRSIALIFSFETYELLWFFIGTPAVKWK